MEAVAHSLIATVMRHRRWWLAFAGLVFVAGCAASLRQLRFEVNDLQLMPTALILMVMTPLSLGYGAVNLLLLSRGSKVSMTFAQAFRANTAAQLAEVLPIPGGALVRTGALVAAGARTGRSAALVLLGAMLWVFVAGSAAGPALLQLTGDQRYLAVFVASFTGVVVISLQLAHLTGRSIALLLLAHRAVGCVLMSARLWLAFAAISKPLPVLAAFVFGLANIAGSAAAIAPAGLGLSELFGAAIAMAISVDPFAAFLAVALNRLLGLISSSAVFALGERLASKSARGK